MVPELNETVGDGSDGDDDVPPRPSEVAVDRIGSARDRCGGNLPWLVGPSGVITRPVGCSSINSDVP